MTTYFSSDWHLGHSRILKLCDRPFASVERMNTAIIDNCNDAVGQDDTLVLLGDTVMGAYAIVVELLRELKAGKVLWIPGNHDRFSLAYRNTEAKKLEIRNHLVAMGLSPQEDRKPSSWRSTIKGHPVVLSHYPYTGDSQDADRNVELRPVDYGLPLVHGHVHTRWKTNGRMLNVGVDQWDFRPVSEDEVAEWIATLPSVLAT